MLHHTAGNVLDLQIAYEFLAWWERHPVLRRPVLVGTAQEVVMPTGTPGSGSLESTATTEAASRDEITPYHWRAVPGLHGRTDRPGTTGLGPEARARAG